MPQAELAALVKEAHEKICPYSHATRGNVDVQLESRAPERKQDGNAAVRMSVQIGCQICVMSRSLVSGRKISPTTKLIAATAIGYQRPE